MESPSWCHHPLLDLESRDYDPVGVMEDVNTLLEGTPKTATRINAGKINKELGDFHIGFGNLRKIDMIMAIHGAWQPPCETTGSSRVYINPTYIHQDHLRDEYYITDAEDRREWLDFVFEHGLVEKDTVATQFGMSTEDFKRTCLRKALIGTPGKTMGCSVWCRRGKRCVTGV